MKYMLKEGEKYPLLEQETIKELNLDIEKIKMRKQLRFRKVFFSFFGCSIVILAIFFGYLLGIGSFALAPYQETAKAYFYQNLLDREIN